LPRADLTTRAVAGFVDLLLIIGLARMPDILGFLSAMGYILVRDGLFERQSIGKKLIGLRVVASDGTRPQAAFRESIIRNVTYAVSYLLFLIPYAGWVLGPLAVGAECLAAIGDERGMRIGDLLARTMVIQTESPAVQSRGAPARQPEPSAPAETPSPQSSQPPA
jgi:uncharacterized RDD family membrane protein YckC